MYCRMKANLLRNQRLKEEKRQSYSECICDDLSQTILQFLSFEDKLRLECVSKQFRRTLFVKSFVLNIGPNDEIYWFVWNRRKVFNFVSFEITLQKCPNLKTIFLDCDYFKERLNIGKEYDQMMALIVTNCHHLTAINCSIGLMTDQRRRQFIEKFGSKLKHLRHYSDLSINALNSMENIEELCLNLESSQLTDISELRLKRLKKLSINWGINGYFLPTLFTNIQSIEVLHISCFAATLLQLSTILTQFSKLINLTEFKFFGSVGLNDRRLKNCMKQMAKKCPKLRTIRCVVVFDRNCNPETNELFSSFKEFNRLKRLELCFWSTSSVDIKMFSCKAFKGFQDLTHLKITFNTSNVYLLDSILSDIDINLPQLQYFNIENNYLEATDWTYLMLRRLTELKTIRLNIINKEMRETIKDKLIEKCKNLKTISV